MRRFLKQLCRIAIFTMHKVYGEKSELGLQVFFDMSSDVKSWVVILMSLPLLRKEILDGEFQTRRH